MKFTKALTIALKKMLSIQMGEVATDKGNLIWDGDADLVAGVEVFVLDENGDAVPAADGEYTTEDGKVIKVVEGKVAEIVDPEAEVAEEEVQQETQEEVKEEENEEVAPADEQEQETTSIEDRVAAIEDRISVFTDGMNQIINSIAALEERIAAAEEKLIKVEEPAADPVDDQPEVKQSKSILGYLRK